jgi:hypothetical protein
VSKKIKKSKLAPKINTTEDGREPFDGEFLDELLLYRVDWDFDTEVEHEGQMVPAVQHVYTFIAVSKNEIGKISEQWDDNAKNLTFRVVSRTPEEDAYRAGLQDGYDTAIAEMRLKSEEESIRVNLEDLDQPTLFD